MTVNLPWHHSEKLNIRKGSSPFASLQHEINKLFDNFFEDVPALWTNSNKLIPAVDVIENDKNFKVEVELAGMRQEDVEVEINDSYLTIKGEKKSSTEDKGDNYIRRERNYGSYQRVIALPETADSSKATATFKKGVLSVEVPKKAEAVAKSKKLEIKEAA